MNDTQELPQQSDPQPFGLSERLVRAIRERLTPQLLPSSKLAPNPHNFLCHVPRDTAPEGRAFWQEVSIAVLHGARDFTPEQFAQLKPVVKAEEPDRCPHCSFDPTSLSDYCSKHRPTLTKPALDPKDAKMIDSDKRAMSPKEAAWAARQVPVIAQPTPTPAPCCGLTTVAQITHRMGTGK